MKLNLTILILLVCALTVHADDKVSQVQGALKDQGFYYGEVTGEKDAVTTDAVRRYQIRNGLQVNGDINDETLKAIQNGASASPTPPAPKVAASPDSDGGNSDLRDNAKTPVAGVADPGQPAPDSEAPAQPYNAQPPAMAPHSPPIYPGKGVPGHDRVEGEGMFAGTPYANSPPEAQRKVIVDAQKTLVRKGLFKNEVDGVWSPNLEFSVRAYQSRVGLHTTGQLDLETLAALELLPGSHEPVFTPRRPPRYNPSQEPPVRGEMVRPPN